MNKDLIISKYKELVEKLEDLLIKSNELTTFYGKIIDANATFLHVHGIKASKEEIETGKRLRKEFEILKSEYKSLLQSLQEQEEKKEPDKDKKEMRDFILSEYEKGNIVFATVDGLCTVPIDEFLKQPEEGILYDLNRSEMVVLAFIDDPKWVNDYAMCKIVRKLLAKVEQLESLNQSGLRGELIRFCDMHFSGILYSRNKMIEAVDEYLKAKER